MHIKANQVIPARWFVAGTIEGDRQGEEYYFFVLRLPSYRYERSWCSRQLEWQQLAFQFHGKHGFEFQWIPALRRSGGRDD